MNLDTLQVAYDKAPKTKSRSVKDILSKLKQEVPRQAPDTSEEDAELEAAILNPAPSQEKKRKTLKPSIRP